MPSERSAYSWHEPWSMRIFGVVQHRAGASQGSNDGGVAAVGIIVVVAVRLLRIRPFSKADGAASLQRNKHRSYPSAGNSTNLDGRRCRRSNSMLARTGGS